MKSGIYKITNNETGKFYIGSSKDIDKRWYDHRRELTLNVHTNPKLQHSWNYYGEGKFSFLILEEVEPIKEKLFEREQYYLDTFKPYIRGIGYNIGSVASGGDNITHNPNKESFIEKMSEICSGEGNPMFGRNHSDISIEKQKDKAKGRFTLEWFIAKYGQVEGEKKYNERRIMLANRTCNVSRPNTNKGKNIGWKHTHGWLERRKSTIEYFNNNIEEFKKLVVSGKYSKRQLSKMLGITRITIDRNIKRLGFGT